MDRSAFADVPLGVWADWLEEQGQDTDELRAWIELGCLESHGSSYGYGYGSGSGYGSGYGYGYGSGSGSGSG